MLFLDPLAGLGFQNIHQLRARDGLMKPDGQMNMVVHTANAISMGFHAGDDICHDREQFRAQVAIQPIRTVLGTEN